MNVALLANSFHLTKTKSSNFFIDILKTWWPIEVIPHKEAWARLSGKHWDLIVSWQKMWDSRELEAFGADRVVLVPMYDDCPKEKLAWEPYRGFRILSFSQTLGADLRAWGHNVMTVQYWQPVPETSCTQDQDLKGFFWPRTSSLAWKHVKLLLGDTTWKSFQLHITDHAESETLPSNDERARFNLEQSSWFDDPLEAQAAVRRANVYFAPRRYEGIGQTVLEALALGLCVVAPDAPTMNEYIVHGETGLLFDPERPEPLDFTNIALLGRKAREKAIQGRFRWEASVPAIKEFLEAPSLRQSRPHPWIQFRGRITAFLRSCYRLLKRVTGRA